MPKPIYQKLFKPLNLNGLRLKNRITMAPLYLGYAAEGGKISRLLLHHNHRRPAFGHLMIMVKQQPGLLIIDLAFIILVPYAPARFDRLHF